MTESSSEWSNSRREYAWEVDLRHFRHRQQIAGHFNRVITAAGVRDFEAAFRTAVDRGHPYQIAAEVCYWENYGSHQSRDNLT